MDESQGDQKENQIQNSHRRSNLKRAMTLQCTIKSTKLETKLKIKKENNVQESKTKSAHAKELEISLLKWKQA